MGIKKKQIDIGVVVQLVSAQLAERNDAEAGAHNAALRVAVLRLSITLFQLAVTKQVGIGKNDIGEGGKLQRRLAQRREAKDILQHDAQVVPPLEARQQGRQPRVRIGGGKPREVLHQVFFGFQLGEIPVARELHHQLRFRQQGLCQVSAVTKNGNEIGEGGGVARQLRQDLRGRALRIALQKVERSVGIRRLGEQRSQGRQQRGRQLLLQALQVAGGFAGIFKIYCRKLWSHPGDYNLYWGSPLSVVRWERRCPLIHQLARRLDQPRTPIVTTRIPNPTSIQQRAAGELSFHSPVRNPTQLAVMRLTTKLSGHPMAGPSFPSLGAAEP